jgi:prepilin-type N-terminal cleavage/methylation domain-containing protein/prepilin-type processing-associated H-X9-DG protein
VKDRHPKIMRCLSLARGFTLIEILVVLGIIVVLAAVAGPAVNSALVSAKSAESVSHLKQTAALVSNYAAENNNRLPVSINWARFSQGGGMWFQNLIAGQSKELQAAPYSATLRLPKMFYDPVLRGKNEHPWGSFGVNVSVVLNDTDYRARFGNGGGTERGLGISLAALTNPSWKVICCSAIEPGWASSWGFDGAVFAQKGFDPKAGPDPRNSGGAAALFADGHVEKLDVENMDQATRRRLFTLEPAR